MSVAYGQAATDSIPDEVVEAPKLQNDSLLKLKKLPIGIYGEYSAELAPGPERFYYANEIAIGLSYGILSLGIFQNDFKDTYQQKLVFPNSFSLVYRYGGLNLGLRYLTIGNFESSLKLAYGKGDFIWYKNETGETFLRDKFSMIAGEIRVTYRPIKPIRIFVKGTYRRMNELDLDGLESSEFDGLGFGIGLSIGLYNE
ncbi:MAG: hypothetical protein ACI8WP_000342 [Flavobacteriaceae bacterium]|jgi:hypothetical protein